MFETRSWVIPRPAAALVVALGVTLCGCSGVGGGMFSNYSISSDDVCASQRQALKAYQDYFFSSMLQGAAIGAVGGGLLGAAIGGNAQSAAIGAASGALVGGATGYYSAVYKANNDPVAVTDKVYSDVDHENQQIDGVSNTFNQLRDCRLRSAAAVKRDYRNKAITQDDATARLSRIRQLYLQDVDFAEGLGKKADERGGQYQDASDQIVKMNPNARSEASSRETAGGGATSGMLVANEAARVRDAASTSGKQIGAIAAGDTVSPASGGTSDPEWTYVTLPSGQTGYVASRLLRPAGTAAPRAQPPKSASGVAELTDSNQLKRKALESQVADAKSEANGSSFELQGGISRSPADHRGAA